LAEVTNSRSMMQTCQYYLLNSFLSRGLRSNW